MPCLATISHHQTHWGSDSCRNYLQYLIDIGLVGIFILYKIVQKTFMKIDKLDLQIFKPIILYLLLIGTLEMGIIINNFICFYFFIALVYYVDYKYYKLNSVQKNKIQLT